MYLKAGPVAFIRSQNVRMSELDLTDVAFIPEAIDESMKRMQITFDDVLLNITGASIGRVAVFNKVGVRANVNAARMHRSAGSKKLRSRYLARYLATPEIQAEIQRIQNGGTRQALNLLANIRLLCPDSPSRRAETDRSDTG